MSDRELAPRAGSAPAMIAGALGIAAVVGGSFLPWVTSGAVQRNLYTVAGVAERVGLLGPGSSLTTWLPLLGPACIAPALLAVLRLRRTAAVVALVVALGCGAFAIAVLVRAGGRSALGMSLAYAGPVTMLIGAAVLAAAAIGLLIARNRARPTGPTPAPPAELGPPGGTDPAHWRR